MKFKIINTSTLNLFFRFLTLGAKMLLSFFVLKYISEADFGIYNMIAKTLTLAIVLLGLDFYTYSQRNILQGEKEEQGQKIRDQFAFYILNYIIFLPLLSLVFFLDVLSWEYILWFYLLLVLDHFTQELYRVLLVFKKPVIASALFFIKVGLWIFPLFTLWILGYNDFMNIQSILSFWTLFELIALLFGLFFFVKLPFKIDFKKPINKEWIKKGLLISLPFFIGTIASNVIEYSDIYMIKAHFELEGDTQVGIYSFFVGMGNIVQMFVQSAILIVFAPKLLESFSKDKLKYNKLHSQMTKQNIIASAGIALVVFIFLYPLVQFLDKTSIAENYNLIYLLVGAKVLFNISMIYHYHLYVRHQDKSIIMSMVLAAIANVILNLILIPVYGIYGAAIATFTSFVMILTLKYIFAKKVIREELTHK